MSKGRRKTSGVRSHLFTILYSTGKPRMNKEKNKMLFSVGV